MIIAHRGKHDRAPENSLPAIRDALAAGVDGVEIDVRFTRDGCPVLSHDPSYRRRPIRWVRRAWLGEVTTLAEALEVLEEADARLVLDVKRHGELPRLLDWLRDRDADLARIAVWCRSAATLAGADTTGCAETALLSNIADIDRYVAAALTGHADAISLHPDALCPDAVAAAHAAGLIAYAWIQDPARHADAIAAGADGVVTDWPGQVPA